MNDTVTAIDIGTTKVAVLICQKDNNNSLELSGLGQAVYKDLKDDGWKSQRIRQSALEKALGQANKMAGAKLNKCTLGIPGEYCGLISNIKEIELDHPVSRQDLMELREQAANYSLPAPWKVCDVIYGNYLADNMSVSNPLGLSCRTLAMKAAIICINTEFVNQLTQTLNTLQMDVEKWVPSPIASAEVLLTEQERENGVLMIDVGGESIDLAIYKQGIPVFLDWIPLGGNIITRDIATGIGVSVEEAEKLKRFCVLGLALREDAEESEMNLPIREGKEIYNVPMELLQKVVEARAEEILDLIKKRIEAENLQKSCQSVVLTGGGLALFRGIREFGFQNIGVPIRLGVPDVIGISGPSLSAVYAIGCDTLMKPETEGLTISAIIKALFKKIKGKF